MKMFSSPAFFSVLFLVSSTARADERYVYVDPFTWSLLLPLSVILLLGVSVLIQWVSVRLNVFFNGESPPEAGMEEPCPARAAEGAVRGVDGRKVA